MRILRLTSIKKRKKKKIILQSLRYNFNGFSCWNDNVRSFAMYFYFISLHFQTKCSETNQATCRSASLCIQPINVFWNSFPITFHAFCIHAAHIATSLICFPNQPTKFGGCRDIESVKLVQNELRWRQLNFVFRKSK